MSNKIDTRSLGENIDKYIRLSNEIKRIDKISRELKKNKSDIEDIIIQSLEKNNLTNKEFIKGNFKISLQQNKKSDGLNQKFIKNAMPHNSIINHRIGAPRPPKVIKMMSKQGPETIKFMKKTKMYTGPPAAVPWRGV